MNQFSDFDLAWQKLTPQAFEQLIFYLLHREGFFDIQWFGSAGHDRGRDITCMRTEVFGLQMSPSKCIVQCKRYSGTVMRSVLAEDIAKAREHHPDYLIIATTGTITASAKDWLNSQQHVCGFRIVLWERLHLQVLLDRHQDLRAQFFKTEVDRDFF